MLIAENNRKRVQYRKEWRRLQERKEFMRLIYPKASLLFGKLKILLLIIIKDDIVNNTQDKKQNNIKNSRSIIYSKNRLNNISGIIKKSKKMTFSAVRIYISEYSSATGLISIAGMNKMVLL